MPKNRNYHVYLKCTDPGCQVKHKGHKWSNEHIRSDNWARSMHRKCLREICQCEKCKESYRELGKYFSPKDGKISEVRRYTCQDGVWDSPWKGEVYKQDWTWNLTQSVREAGFICTKRHNPWKGYYDQFVPTS